MSRKGRGFRYRGNPHKLPGVEGILLDATPKICAWERCNNELPGRYEPDPNKAGFCSGECALKHYRKYDPDKIVSKPA